MQSSLPSRGAWIEIREQGRSRTAYVSLPSRGAWIEIPQARYFTLGGSSLPSRGAWIEITKNTGTNSKQGRRSPRGERG